MAVGIKIVGDFIKISIFVTLENIVGHQFVSFWMSAQRALPVFNELYINCISLYVRRKCIYASIGNFFRSISISTPNEK